MSVSDNIKLPELTEQLSDIGADMLVDCLKALPKSIENAQPQVKEGVTYGMLHSKEYLFIFWKWTRIWNVYKVDFVEAAKTSLFSK